MVNYIAKTGKIIAVPFVFVLVRISGTVLSLWVLTDPHVLMQKVGKDHAQPPLAPKVFQYLAAFFDVSQGWVNWILYFATTKSELLLKEKMLVLVRSIPYFSKIRRAHSSQNSYLTYNTSNLNRSSNNCTTDNSSNTRNHQLTSPVESDCHVPI